MRLDRRSAGRLGEAAKEIGDLVQAVGVIEPRCKVRRVHAMGVERLRRIQGRDLDRRPAAGTALSAQKEPPMPSLVLRGRPPLAERGLGALDRRARWIVRAEALHSEVRVPIQLLSDRGERGARPQISDGLDVD